MIAAGRGRCETRVEHTVQVPRSYLLVHPPLLGPAVWRPVAERLTAAGHTALVPDLRAELEPPAGWGSRAAAMAAAVAGEDATVVVGHSGAGVLLPLIAARLTTVHSIVFVDAVLPARSGATAPPADLLALLRKLPIEDDRLPPWSTWWGPEAMARLVPDERQRELIEAEQERLPLAFYDEAVPVPATWPDQRVAYLRLSPAYEDAAREAAERGWAVETLAGHHLDLVSRAAEVAERVDHLATVASRETSP
jgi:hypothetical protein